MYVHRNAEWSRKCLSSPFTCTERLEEIRQVNNYFELSDISALSFRAPNVPFNATTTTSLTSAANTPILPLKYLEVPCERVCV